MKTIKKFWNMICRKPMLWFFILVALIYTPQAVMLPAENDVVVVCTGVGVDKAEEGIELSLLTLIPQNSMAFAESYRLTSAKAQNVALAINKLVNYLGKRVDLAHAGYVIFGKEICSDGIKSVIEDLVGSHDIGTNAVVLTTNTTAKDVFELTKQFDANSGEKVKDILYNNKRSLLDVNTSIDRFYEGYLSESSCSIVNTLKLVTEKGEGVEASQSSSQGGSGGGGSSSGGSGSSGGGGGEKKKVLNDGSCVVFKNAKQVMDLSVEETQAINLPNSEAYEGRFVIEDYKTKEGNLVDVSFNVLKKQVKSLAQINNNQAKIDWEVHFVLDILGVESEKDDEILKNPQKNFEDEQMQQKISEKFRTQFFSIVEKLRPQDLDCLGVNDLLRRCGGKKYRKFVESLGENPNILQNVELNLKVSFTTQ